MNQTLPPQPWMDHPATRRVMDALCDAGGEDSARFVGGCVRDALLGRGRHGHRCRHDAAIPTR